jgi:Mrr N-terminal domain
MDHEISVDNDVFGLLQSEAVPFVDTPNTVLRRLLGLDGSTPQEESGATGAPDARPAVRKRRQAPKPKNVKRSRAPKGVLLPESEYELPILTALVELGGKVPASEVLTALEPKIKNLLQPLDFEPLEGSGLVRWKNRAQFCRLKLVHRGDLVDGSPRGVWEISDQGRQRAMAEPQASASKQSSTSR